MDIYQLLMVVTFLIGYLLIVGEHYFRIDKATSALMMAVICWSIQFLNAGVPSQENAGFLGEHLGSISQVIFFLVGALTIVETISAHGGFSFLTRAIQFRSKRVALWVMGLLTFILAAIVGSLTITIVMISIVQKIVKERHDELVMGSAVVIAANAGGAWAPIGDLTTTMLWVGGQVSTLEVMRSLILPSIACTIGALLYMMFLIKGEIAADASVELMHVEPKAFPVFLLGMSSLISVPIFRALTGLPPFMGVLCALSIMWIATDLFHRNHPDRTHLRVGTHLAKIDMSGVMFFLGILLCVDALDVANLLNMLARGLDALFDSKAAVACTIGLFSAVIDNVPLVAACQGMYSLVEYPSDHPFWQMIAYCAGTGGSVLIIGSASGVAFMGMSQVDFFWYVKKASLPALIGYFLGLFVYLMSKGFIGLPDWASFS